VGSWLVDDAVSLGVPRTYRAHHASVGTSALLEVMPLSKATQEGQQREVVALKKLNHRCVPEVLDYGVDHERELVWTVFKWFDGEPLEDRLLRGTIRWERACAILRDLASALVHVHTTGLVHRDLRPANVVVSDRDSRLVGFDFALTQQQLESMSQAPFGDLAYLAPEVLRDPTHHGAKADVYAFGCVAFELLTGKPAFPASAWGERPDQAVRMLEWKSRTTPLDPGGTVPDWLRSMVQKCTEPSPDRRLPDLDALVGWLDAARGSWEGKGLEGSEEPELDDDGPDFEPTTGEVAIPTPVRPVAPPPPIRIAPALAPVRPTLRSPPTPPTMPRSVGAPYDPLPLPPPPGLSPTMQILAASAAGVASALGFSALLILFVELSDGAM
jgi:serine/threonine protein kinase